MITIRALGAQQVGAEQTDSQLMMADQRGLRSLEARCSNHALLTRNHSSIEEQEVDRLIPLDQLRERRTLDQRHHAVEPEPLPAGRQDRHDGCLVQAGEGAGDGQACLVDVRDGTSTVLAAGPAAKVCAVSGDGRRAVVRLTP